MESLATIPKKGELFLLNAPSGMFVRVLYEAINIECGQKFPETKYFKGFDIMSKQMYFLNRILLQSFAQCFLDHRVQPIY